VDREALDELSEFFRYYKKALDTADIDKRFESVLEKLSLSPSIQSESLTAGIELLHQPYIEPFAGEHPWAAATELPEEEMLRFCSKDGRYMLREFPDSQTGKRSFHFIGDSRNRAKGIEVVIDGKSLFPDEFGIIDIDTDGLRITKDSKILLKGDLPY